MPSRLTVQFSVLPFLLFLFLLLGLEGCFSGSVGTVASLLGSSDSGGDKTPPRPILTTIDPSTGPVAGGMSITVVGELFGAEITGVEVNPPNGPGAIVRPDDIDVFSNPDTDDLIVFRLPRSPLFDDDFVPTAGEATIIVETENGDSVNELSFVYAPVSIESIDPPQVVRGGNVGEPPVTMQIVVKNLNIANTSRRVTVSLFERAEVINNDIATGRLSESFQINRESVDGGDGYETTIFPDGTTEDRIFLTLPPDFNPSRSIQGLEVEAQGIRTTRRVDVVNPDKVEVLPDLLQILEGENGLSDVRIEWINNPIVGGTPFRGQVSYVRIDVFFDGVFQGSVAGDATFFVQRGVAGGVHTFSIIGRGVDSSDPGLALDASKEGPVEVFQVTVVNTQFTDLVWNPATPPPAQISTALLLVNELASLGRSVILFDGTTPTASDVFEQQVRDQSGITESPTEFSERDELATITAVWISLGVFPSAFNLADALQDPCSDESDFMRYVLRGYRRGRFGVYMEGGDAWVNDGPMNLVLDPGLDPLDPDNVVDLREEIFGIARIDQTAPNFSELAGGRDLEFLRGMPLTARDRVGDGLTVAANLFNPIDSWSSRSSSDDHLVPGVVDPVPQVLWENTGDVPYIAAVFRDDDGLANSSGTPLVLFRRSIASGFELGGFPEESVSRVVGGFTGLVDAYLHLLHPGWPRIEIPAEDERLRPEIISLIPSRGSVAGGTSMKILGLRFSDDDLSVEYLFDDPNGPDGKTAVSLVDVEFVSTTELSAVTPPSVLGLEQTVDVRVSRGGVSTQLDNAFRYDQTPEVRDVFPRSAEIASAATITIIGSNFGDEANPRVISVFLGQNELTDLRIIDNTALEAVVVAERDSVGIVDVTITVIGGELVTLAASFEFLLPDDPLVSGFKVGKGDDLDTLRDFRSVFASEICRLSDENDDIFLAGFNLFPSDTFDLFDPDSGVRVRIRIDETFALVDASLLKVETLGFLEDVSGAFPFATVLNLRTNETSPGEFDNETGAVLRVRQSPTISSVEPAVGIESGGYRITIKGSSFPAVGNLSVRLPDEGGRVPKSVSISPNEISFILPEDPEAPQACRGDLNPMEPRDPVQKRLQLLLELDGLVCVVTDTYQQSRLDLLQFPMDPWASPTIGLTLGGEAPAFTIGGKGFHNLDRIQASLVPSIAVGGGGAIALTIDQNRSTPTELVVSIDDPKSIPGSMSVMSLVVTDPDNPGDPFDKGLGICVSIDAVFFVGPPESLAIRREADNLGPIARVGQATPFRLSGEGIVDPRTLSPVALRPPREDIPSGQRGGLVVRLGGLSFQPTQVAGGEILFSPTFTGDGVVFSSIETFAGVSSAGDVEVLDPPICRGFLPTQGEIGGGTSVRLSGENLFPTMVVPQNPTDFVTSVLVGSESATIVSASPTEVVIVVPPALSGKGESLLVRYSNALFPDETERVDCGRYSYLPTITSLDAKVPFAVLGDTGGFTISGQGFNPDRLQAEYEVSVGEVVAVVDSVDCNSLTVSLSVDSSRLPGLRDIVVRQVSRSTTADVATFENAFAFGPALQSVNPVDPSFGPVCGGNEITVTGVGFSNLTRIEIQGIGELINTMLGSGGTTIRGTVPAAVAIGGSRAIAALETFQGASGPIDTVSAVTDAYRLAFSVASVEPTSGSAMGGETVFVMGSGLTEDTRAFFEINGVRIPLVDRIAMTDEKTGEVFLQGKVPELFGPAGVADVVVACDGATGEIESVGQGLFTYLTSPTSIDPESNFVTAPSTAQGLGKGQGSTVSMTVSGRGFTDQTQVQFDPPEFARVVGSPVVASDGTSIDIEVELDRSGRFLVSTLTSGEITQAVPGFFTAFPRVDSFEDEGLDRCGPLGGGERVTIRGKGFIAFSPEAVLQAALGRDRFLEALQVRGDETIEGIVPSASSLGSVLLRVGHLYKDTNRAFPFRLPGAYTYGPDILSVDPDLGPLVGGNVVTITGLGLGMGTRVFFDTNEVPIEDLTFINGNIEVIVPNSGALPSEQPVAVDVGIRRNLGGTICSDLLVGGYVYSDSPITAILPDNAPLEASQGTTVTIFGLGFDQNTTATIGSQALSGVQVQAGGTQLVGALPATISENSGVVDVQVFSPSTGTTVVPEAFAFTAVPSVVSDSDGNLCGPLNGGESLMVGGQGLRLLDAGLVEVAIGDALLQNKDFAKGVLTGNVPSAPDGTPRGLVPIVFQQRFSESKFAGRVFEARLARDYEYTAELERILSGSAGSFAGGDPIEIRGRGLDIGLVYLVGGLPLENVDVPDLLTVRGTVPRLPAPPDPDVCTEVVSVEVQDGLCTDAADDSFTYLRRPEVLSVDPSVGNILAGELVTLTGTFLSSTTALGLPRVRFEWEGGETVIPSDDVTFVDDTQITVFTPTPQSCTARVFVDNGCAESVEDVLFVYGQPYEFDPFPAGLAVDAPVNLLGVPDLTGDLVNDLLVGLPTASSDSGHLALFPGRLGGTIDDGNSIVFDGSGGVGLGWSLGGVDDALSQNSGLEILVGAPLANGAFGIGQAVLFGVGGGGGGQLVLTVAKTLSDPAIPDPIGNFFGSGVCFSGQASVNGDFAPDILVGDPLADLMNPSFNVSQGGQANIGAAYVYFGPVDLVVSPSGVIYNPDAEEDLFGYVVRDLGDVDGDSVSDFAVSAPLDDFSTDDNTGSVWVFFGSPTGPPESYQGVKIFHPERAANDRFGETISVGSFVPEFSPRPQLLIGTHGGSKAYVFGVDGQRNPEFLLEIRAPGIERDFGRALAVHPFVSFDADGTSDPVLASRDGVFVRLSTLGDFPLLRIGTCDQIPFAPSFPDDGILGIPPATQTIGISMAAVTTGLFQEGQTPEFGRIVFPEVATARYDGVTSPKVAVLRGVLPPVRVTSKR